MTSSPQMGRAKPAGRPSSKAGGETGSRRIDSRMLFGDARMLPIHHEGSVYYLRITSLGKLILTK